MKNKKLTNIIYGIFTTVIFSASMISCATTKNGNKTEFQPEPQPKKYECKLYDEHSENIFTFTIFPDNTYTLHLDKYIVTSTYFNPDWNFPVIHVNIDFEKGTIKGNPEKKKKIKCYLNKYFYYDSSPMIKALLEHEFPELLNNKLKIEEILAYISPYLKNTGAKQKDIDKITIGTSHGYFFLTVLEKLAEEGRFEYELTNSDFPLGDFPYIKRNIPVLNNGKELKLQSCYNEFGTQTFTLVE